MVFLNRLRQQFCQPLVVALLTSSMGTHTWASGTAPEKPGHTESTPVTEPAKTNRVGKKKPPEKTRSENSSLAAGSFRSDLRRLASDQKAIWTSPWHLRARDADWLVPFGAGTWGLAAGDHDLMRHLGNSSGASSRKLGDYGVAAMAGTAAALYLRGHIKNDQHSREAGVLAGQASVDSVIVAEAMKLTFRRSRPDAANGGSFGAGGASFPSEHAMAAWSLASVAAQEYPGPLTKLLAYGAASGISVSRITAREHFPSDEVVGSALGYLIGRQVYRSHHERDLPGASWEAFDEKAKFVRGPSRLGSPYVPLDSWVYPAFDRLAALGYAPSAFSSQRPWTRMECARLLKGAGEELSGADSRRSETYGLFAALAAEFNVELQRWQGSGSSEVRLDSIYTRYTGIAGTPLDDGYHFGQTIVNDFGRPYGG